MPKIDIHNKIVQKFVELDEGIDYLTEETLELLDHGQVTFETCMLYAILACAMYPSLYATLKERVDCAPKSLRVED